MSLRTFITAAVLTLSASMTMACDLAPDNISTDPATAAGSRVVRTYIGTDGSVVSDTVTIESSADMPFFIDSSRPLRWNINNLLRRTKRHGNSSATTTTRGAEGIYVGGVIPLGNHGPVTGGWEIGVSNLIGGEWQPGKGLPSIAIGAGLGWRIQTVGHGTVLSSDHGVLAAVGAPEGVSDARSRIKNFHFIVPVTVNIPIRKSFGLSVAGELNLNTYTTASTSWTEPTGTRVSHSFKGLHQRIATVDITAALGWREGIGIYARYSPMKPWKAGYGPQYRSLSLGAIINF